MPPQFRPLPKDFVLGDTLAQRIQILRDYRNMTTRDLGKYSRFGTQRVEDLEAGIETWLSATDRQLLAKALVVEPALIQEVESKPPTDDEKLQDAEAQIVQAIFEGARELECPKCGHTLKCSLVDALDIDGHPVRFAKAYCLQCPFVLR